MELLHVPEILEYQRVHYLHGVNYTLIMMGQYLQEAGVIMKAMRQRKMPDYAESLEMHRML